MRREDVFGYQEDSTNPNVSFEAMGWESEDARIGEQVQEVLGMPGYQKLHQLFVARVEHADKRLRDKSMSGDEMRFEQGVIEGLLSVQHAFIELGKIRRSEDAEQ